MKENYRFKSNYWGIGVDFGIPLFSVIDWKIVEGGITFFNVELKQTRFENGNQVFSRKIENSEFDVGYYLASGLIIHLIKDYISIEGTVAYNIYKIEEFTDDNGELIILDNNSSFIENKGITPTFQLNLGFPL